MIVINTVETREKLKWCAELEDNEDFGEVFEALVSQDIETDKIYWQVRAADLTIDEDGEPKCTSKRVV